MWENLYEKVYAINPLPAIGNREKEKSIFGQGLCRSVRAVPLQPPRRNRPQLQQYIL